MDQIITDGGGFGLVLLRDNTERVCGEFSFPSNSQSIEDSSDDT